MEVDDIAVLRNVVDALTTTWASQTTPNPRQLLLKTYGVCLITMIACCTSASCQLIIAENPYFRTDVVFTAYLETRLSASTTWTMNDIVHVTPSKRNRSPDTA